MALVQICKSLLSMYVSLREERQEKEGGDVEK